MARTKGSKNKGFPRPATLVDTQKINDKVTEVVVDAPKKALEQLSKAKTDPQTLFNNLLEANGLQLDFSVIPEETVLKTQFGLVKLDKQQLVLKATYVSE